MTGDLVERLRSHDYDHAYNLKTDEELYAERDEAADRIEALEAENERLTTENERLRNGLDAALNAIEFVRVRDGLMQDENELCNIARAALGERQ